MPKGCFPSLQYIVTVPDDMNSENEKLPLIVFLHGTAAHGGAQKLAIRVFHGDADTVVPLSYSQQMVEAVQKAGGNILLTVYLGVDHSSRIPAYQTSDVIEWLVSHKRGE